MGAKRYVFEANGDRIDMLVEIDELKRMTVMVDSFFSSNDFDTRAIGFISKALNDSGYDNVTRIQTYHQKTGYLAGYGEPPDPRGGKFLRRQEMRIKRAAVSDLCWQLLPLITDPRNFTPEIKTPNRKRSTP